MADVTNGIPCDNEIFDNSEHKGLGTPATRAGIIEKLIKSGLIERQKKALVPTAKGMSLIAVLPDDIKSPSLTSTWEQMLKSVERGELSGDDFMAGIKSLVSGLVAVNTAPVPEMVSMFASMPNEGCKSVSGATKGKAGAVGGKVVGRCPRCGSGVTESAKGFFCSSGFCKFALWKESRFWAAKGKILTAKTAAVLLDKGSVSFSDLKSERTGKTYAATIILADDGSKTDFKLDFEKSGKSGGSSL